MPLERPAAPAEVTGQRNDVFSDHKPKPPSRPKSARLADRGGTGKPPTSPRQATSISNLSGWVTHDRPRRQALAAMQSVPLQQMPASSDGLLTKSVDRHSSLERQSSLERHGGSVAFGSSVRGRTCGGCHFHACDQAEPERLPKAGGGQEFEVVSALMLSVLNTFEVREDGDLWTKLLNPLKALVPCDDVKVVVRCLGAPPPVAEPMGPFDPTVKMRHKKVTYVEHWNEKRIDGQAALTQRMQRIPSQENNRHHWDQYEVAKSQIDSLRCMVAVPLFDADSNVLAVLKFINRSSTDGLPILEFSKSDQITLSAFAAIFTCILPHPYLGMPGAALQRRPQARIALSDRAVGAVVSWQVPMEMKGMLVHEIRYGEVSQEDEYAGHSPQANWAVMPCGLLEPRGGPEDLETNFEFTVPVLETDAIYAFSVRLRNQRTSLPWSEPSMKLSTFLAPPHSTSSEVQRIPVGGGGIPDSVEVEWCPFQTCDPNLHLIEYRVIAIVHKAEILAGNTTQRHPQSHASRTPGLEAHDEQVVAVFISDGRHPRESVTVSSLQSNLTYSFAVEARYPYVGTREFTRTLVSDFFSWPTIDITLPAPQPVCSHFVNREMSQIIAEGAGPTTEPIVIRWPYPSDLLPQLVLQYRVAIMCDGNVERSEHQNERVSGRIALHTSNWVTVRSSSCFGAELVTDDAASKVRVLCDQNLEDSLAVQLRVIKGRSASPPSVWFHPQPPAPPQQVIANCVSSDEEGSAIQIFWMGNGDRVFANDYDGPETQELGPISYAVHHDFCRGNGTCSTRFQVRLRAVSAGGDPRADWEELAPQLLPARCRQLPSHIMRFLGSSTSNLSCCYRWLLHEQRWFTQPGVTFDVQLRHGNDLFWSSWVPANLLQIQFDPPKTAAGDALRMLDVRHDSVRLTWMPFLPCEDGLRALEYRILCKELPDNCETNLEVGRSLVSWRTIDAIDAEGSSDMSPLQYTVRSLAPERRYKFAVECRYLSLPPVLAAEPAFICRMETSDPLPARSLQVLVEPGSISAVVGVAQRLGSQPIVQQCGFVLHIRWKFHSRSPQAALPGMFCYQLRCLPQPARVGQDDVLLPPAVLSERGRSHDGVGSFVIDSARIMTADVELCSGAIEAILPKEAQLRFAVRIGEFASGRVIWNEWSETLSNHVILSLAPPRPAGNALTVNEHIWGIYADNLLPQGNQHSVEAVTLAWSSFNRNPDLPLEEHARLIVQYEIVVWVVHTSASLERVRNDLSANTASPNDVREVFRQRIQAAHGESQHYFRVPGDHLQPLKYHFFEVKAAYLFANGDTVSEPAGTQYESLLSEEPYRPTSRQLAPPELEQYIAPHDESTNSCAFLCLPSFDRSDYDPEPVSIEYREGAIYAGRPESELAVLPSGEWTLVSDSLVDRLPGEKSRVFIRQLRAQICQFRILRGSSTSEPSLWTDTSVWVPTPLAGSQLQLQMRRSPSFSVTAKGSVGRLQGFGVALGVGRENLLFARLAWPRHPLQPSVIKLVRYQLRYRNQDQTWCVLPIVELPSLDASCAEAVVSDLRRGCSYEFSLRLCNALGRWSEWSDQTIPLHLDLPAPAPAQGLERNATLRVNSITPACARLSWRPFSIAQRSSTWSNEPPLWIDDASESRTAVCAEYELVVCEESGDVVRNLQLQGPVMFDELPLEDEYPWMEEDVQVEPNRSYVFKLRARLRTGSWGPMLESASLPPRLMPIGVSIPLVDLLLKQNEVDGNTRDAILHFEATVKGFSRGQTHDTLQGNQGADRLVAALSQYQLRSCPVASSGECWSEWTPADAIAAHNPAERTVSVSVAMRTVTALAPGAKYIFSMRCCDTFGRWSDWSTSSEPIALRVPALVPALTEDVQGSGANLKLMALGPTAVRLEWTQFRSDWDSTIPMKALDAALQRVEYKIRMAKRLDKSTAEWTSIPLAELTSERRSTQAMVHSVTDLDERFEYVFSVSARWMDVPLALGVQSWSTEVSSAILPSRLPELRCSAPPCAEVSASDDGICMVVKWCPSPALRDISNLPLPGARYQLRYVQLLNNAIAHHDLQESPNWEWKQEAPVLEDHEHYHGSETVCRVCSLSPGHTYAFSVRLGDNYRWSAWSSPSLPCTLAVATPTPSAGDLLEMSLNGTSSSVTLEWRPFRSASSLSCVEYKVMALEWPFEYSSNEEGVLSRLKRVAQDAAAETSTGYSQGMRVERSFNVAGYVTKQSASGGKLRATGDRVQWKWDGLKAARNYRFFVCARYACLPMAAMLPPPSAGGSTLDQQHLQVRMWPDEAYGHLFDSVAWEASLSRCGLWSAVVNTAHVPQHAFVSSIESLQHPGMVLASSLRDASLANHASGEDAREIAQLLNRSAQFDQESPQIQDR